MSFYAKYPASGGSGSNGPTGAVQLSDGSGGFTSDATNLIYDSVSKDLTVANIDPSVNNNYAIGGNKLFDYIGSTDIEVAWDDYTNGFDLASQQPAQVIHGLSNVTGILFGNDPGSFVIGVGGSLMLGSGNNNHVGDVIVQPFPTTGGARGKIKLQDGSEGTSGQVWASTDTVGSGAWTAIGPNFDFGDGSDGTANLNGTNSTAWAARLYTFTVTAVTNIVAGTVYTSSGATFGLVDTGSGLTTVHAWGISTSGLTSSGTLTLAPISGASGSDATITYSSFSVNTTNYYMVRPARLVGLSVQAGVTLHTNGFSLSGTGTLQNAGTIDNSGSNGGNGGVGGQGAGGAGGIPGGYGGNIVPLQLAAQDLQFGSSGGAGGTGSTGAGAVGVVGNPIIGAYLGADGGNGGAGGNGAGGSGAAAVGTSFSQWLYAWSKLKVTNTMVGSFSGQVAPYAGGIGGSGGSSGAGDNVNSGGGGGGGGGAGGVLAMFFATIQNSGVFSANGGGGGNGESPATHVAAIGGGGAGGGGAGGLIFIITKSYSPLGTRNVNGGSHGVAGSGAAGGTNGGVGVAGQSGIVITYNVNTGVWS